MAARTRRRRTRADGGRRQRRTPTAAAPPTHPTVAARPDEPTRPNEPTRPTPATRRRRRPMHSTGPTGRSPSWTPRTCCATPVSPETPTRALDDRASGSATGSVRSSGAGSSVRSAPARPRRSRTGALAAIVVLDRAPTAAGAFLGTLLARRRAARRVRAARPPHRRGVGPGRRSRSGSGSRGAGSASARAPRPAGCSRPSAPVRCAGLLRHPHPDAPPRSRGVRIADAALPRPPDRRARPSARAPADRGARVPRGRVLAARRRGPGAALARWGLVLAGAAGGAVRRIQWIERTAPAQGDELARWLHAERDPAVPLRGTPMIESYLELIGNDDAGSPRSTRS